jgi:hypothetical protein
MGTKPSAHGLWDTFKLQIMVVYKFLFLNGWSKTIPYFENNRLGLAEWFK